MIQKNSLAQYIEWDALARISFVNCNFENGKIFGSCTFQNCTTARKAKFSSWDFDSCKFKGTRFLKSNLDLILVEDGKVWKSKEWVEISFEKQLDE